MIQDKIEQNLGLLVVLTMLAISVGGMVEIIPLFFIKETVETVKGADGKEMVHPYTPLEVIGRDIYVREGCFLCHSQMIRPFRDEALRYGHYSLAAESKYDHPFQWGSKRTGPDLARVGGKYSNDWQTQHLTAPRSLVPQSVMPNYPWLAKNPLNYADIAGRMQALRVTGVPYSVSEAELKANVTRFGEDVAKTLHIPDAEKNLIAQSQSGNFDTNENKLTEMDALVAYLQVLGTMVDFKQFDDDYFSQYR